VKLNIKQDNIHKFSYKDLDYALTQIYKQLDKNRELCPDPALSWKFEKYVTKFIIPLDNKIKLIQDEMSNRILTGNDDGVFEEVLLGDKNVR